jgi:diguanylate cyclase (GGDEF)-like protein
VASIDRALSILGTNIIKNIALSFVIVTDLRGEKQSGFNFDAYWRRSVTSAVAAELLMQQLKQKDEDIFVAALLHDIGMLIIFLHKRNDYSELLQEARLSEQLLVTLEHDRYGFDHQQVSCTLMKRWGLPDKITKPICYHHNPESAPEDSQKTARILQFADQISTIYNETDSAEKVRELQGELAKCYSFSQDQILSLLDNVAAKSIKILETFEIEPGDMKPYSQMLQEANEELGCLNLSYEQLVIELKEAKEKSERLVHKLKNANSRLNDMAYTDALTGLYNHRYFQESLSKELARSAQYLSSVSLIIFDLDHFKKINDIYGHLAGDQVLINIANTIKKTIRPSDIIARYGGEEFAVILPETDITGVKVFAARLRRCVERIITKFEEKKIIVTISVGGTTFSPGQLEITKNILIKIADRGLYMSKEKGRNLVTILATENNIY